MKWAQLVPLALLLTWHSADAGELWVDDPITNTAFVSANLLMAADWAQTRHIADNPDYTEQGPASRWIGENPTPGDVNRYFVASIVVMNAVGYFLPEKWKRNFYIGYSIYEGYYVHRNASVGIKIRF